MGKVYIELVCDEDVAQELMTYPPDRCDIITVNDNPKVVEEMQQK
jgi:hypothetical protein